MDRIQNVYKVTKKQWEKWKVGNELPRELFNLGMAEANDEKGDSYVGTWNASFSIASRVASGIKDKVVMVNG